MTDLDLTVIRKQYSFSFTAASALINESLLVAKCFLECRDWEIVRNRVQAENLLNNAKHATFKREFQEIQKRLVQLTSEELRLLVEGRSDAARNIVFVSILKTYDFVYDFLVEVVRNKVLHYDDLLLDSDYTGFLETKANSHPEILALSETSAGKVKQVLFRFLREAGFIVSISNKRIVRPVLDPESLKLIVNDNPDLLRCFLMSDSEIKSATMTYRQ